MLGIEVSADSAVKYGISLQKSITIKGYQNSTAEKLAKEINQDKKKYKKSWDYIVFWYKRNDLCLLKMAAFVCSVVRMPSIFSLVS